MFDYDYDNDINTTNNLSESDFVRPQKIDPRFQDYNRLEKDIDDESSNKKKKKRDDFER